MIYSKWDSTKDVLLCGTWHVELVHHYGEMWQDKVHKSDGVVQHGSSRGVSICLAVKTAYHKYCMQMGVHQSVPFHAEVAHAYGQMPWNTNYNDVHVYLYVAACESANKHDQKTI